MTMTDYHTHVLPEIDDGSKSISMSLEMLQMFKQQGITSVACTPHYYPTREDPNSFLKRRERSFAALQEAIYDGLPSLLLGAEFYYYEGISHLDCLDDFIIQGTGLLLVEMPFTNWSSRWIDEIFSLNEKKEFRVMLAHINRYFKYVDMNVIRLMASNGVAFQINNESFSSFLIRRKVMRLYSSIDMIYLGSDAHNIGARRPNWDIVPSGILDLYI